MAAERSAKQAQAAAATTEKTTADKAIHAANTALAVYGDVMGAYGKVMGATGALAEKAVVAVFSKLKFMQGIACLPASSQLDPVIGIDVHFVMIPPSPSPVPMPHPYIATVFDPKDWIACAVMSVKAMVPPPPPGNAGAQLASTVGNMAFGMIMGKLGLGASVKLGSATPRTISGVKNKTIPHFPMGASFAPVPVLKNSGHAQFGSLFLLADGEPFTGMMHLNNDCWDVGIMQLMRKKASPEAQHLFMPTGFVMAIPSHNVIVNPVPTPINPIAALTKLLNFGIAKLLHKLIRKLPGGRLSNALHKAVCHVTGHPVDVVSGMLFTDEEDFALPGVIPLSWERTWYSDSIYQGPLGHGWYHNYDMAFGIDEKTNQAAFRMNDGRMVGFDIPLPGKFTYDRAEKLFLHHHEDGYFFIEDREGLLYRFTEASYQDNQHRSSYSALKSISNRNGFSIRFEYDAVGCLIKIIDSANRILDVENDDEGRIVNIVAPHPTEHKQKFVIAHYDYDDDGNMICHTDALGQKMKFEYEGHLLVKETWRDGMQWYFRYEGKTNGSRCIHTWGDGDIYNHKLTYLDGCTMVENSLGYTTSYYHNKGLLYNKVDANGAEWGYRYNRFNELEWETDPLGNQHNYSHDDWGNVITTTDPCGGFTSTEYYHPKFPLLPTAAMDAAGGKWKWEYDELGNLIEKVNPIGAKIKYQFSNGLVCKIVSREGATVNIEYDRQNNISVINTDPEVNTKYYYDELGNCTAIINPKGVTQSRCFDLKCRLVSLKEFDGNDIQLRYDGIDNMIHYRDRQKETKYTYSGLWKLTSRTQGSATVNFKYNTEEQLVGILNEFHQEYSFELDAEGKIIGEIGFDKVTRRYNRNSAGWITDVLRPGGKGTKYQHDGCGRVSTVLYSDGNIENYVFRQDGELVKITNQSAVVEFQRNLIGDILKETVNGDWVQSEYDFSGNRIKTTSNLGAEISQKYSKTGEVLSIESKGWNAAFGYDKLGLEVERLLSGDIVSTWLRDGIGRPVSHSLSKGTTGMRLIKNKTYQWDVNDRLNQIKDQHGVTRFEYDVWFNLSKTTFSDGEEQLRNPDAVGNLFKSYSRVDRKYGKGGQLQKTNNWTFRYDLEGNLIQKKHKDGETWTYYWNDAGMLSQIIRGDNAVISFTYDALGRRLTKQYKNTITKFVWDGNEILHEYKEHAITGQKLSDSTVGDNGVITWIFDADTFAPAAKIRGTKHYSIITDHIGTPTQMYQADGSLCWEARLDSYGKVNMQRGDAGSCPFRYQGQYEDIETGLYYNRLRYYSPDDGVYISQDPLETVGGLQLYSYVANPNLWVDIFGLYPVYASCKLKKSEYKKSDAYHFRQANKALHRKFKRDPAFAKMMEKKYPGIVNHVKPGIFGGTSRTAPEGTTWHHSQTPGRMELVDYKDHHDNHGEYHKGGKGGRAIWGGGRDRR